MKKLFLFLLASALSASGAHATAFTTADVVRIAVPEVKRIFGDDREDTFINDGLLREAILDFIGIPDDPQALRDGSTMMTGCRPNSCGEKGAVIVNGQQNQLRAAALLHFHCHLTVLENEESHTRPGNQCDTEPTLEIFVIRRNRTLVTLKQELSYVRELEAWGKRQGLKNEVIHVKEVPRAR